MRRAVAAVVQNRKQFLTLPAPVRGWIENDILAANLGNGCSVLENGFPTASSVRARGGALLKTSLGAGVESLIPYKSGSVAKLFATTASDLYDISLFPLTATSHWGQLSAGRWSFVQFAIAGIEYLVMVNGANFAMYYDGSNWNPIFTSSITGLNYDALTQDFIVNRTVTGGTSGATGIITGILPSSATAGTLKLRTVSGTFVDNEALTGSGAGGAATANGAPTTASSVAITGVATTALSHVWMHNSRLWFVEEGTTKAWYLPVDQIGGAAVSFDLGGLLTKGGSLRLGATWSSDSGSGFAERNVFVSTEGEIIVYTGDDPASNYAIAGHYDVGKPISTQTMKAGGDLILATEGGMVPMSAVVMKDRAALSQASITFPIEPAWRNNHSTNTTLLPVQICKWHAKNMAIVGWPHRLGKDAFVVNLITGAWAKWTGLDVQCMALHDGLAYFGDSSGNVYQFEGSGSDNGAPYVWRVGWLPDPLGAPGAYKVVSQGRATFRSLVPFTAKLSAAADYGRLFPPPPDAAPTAGTPAIWDVGVWDVSKFDDAPTSESRVTAITRWTSIGVGGAAISPQVQVTVGGTRIPDAELVSYDVAFTPGGYVV